MIILPKVLIVILNYSTYDYSIKLIQDIKMHLDYPDYRILVIDNCSPNESPKVLEEKKSELDYLFIPNNDNRGYAAGNNIGIRYAIRNGYKYTWILNNDVILREPYLLSTLVGKMERNANIGCVGPKIYSNDGSICAPYCERPNLWTLSIGRPLERIRCKRFCEESRIVYRVYGCCMLLSNKAMEEIDCMDERTFLYGEEDILAERLLNKGYYTFYDASVGITHVGSVSMANANLNRKKTYIIATQKSAELYMKEYRHYKKPIRLFCHAISSLITLIR